MQRTVKIPLLGLAAVSLMGVNAWGVETPSAATTETLSAEAKEGTTLAAKIFESSDPKEAREKLSDAERKKFDAATMPGPIEEVEKKEVAVEDDQGDEATRAGGSRCYGYNQTFKRKALAGNTLYTYWQSTHVCHRGGRVTSVKVTNAGGETSTPGWRVDKGPKVSTKNVGWEGRGNARYHFVLGVGGWDIAHPTDCIQQRLNANGHSHRSMNSCNLDAR